MRRALHLLFSLSILVIISGCKGNGVRSIKLGHSLDINHSVHLAMVKMGEELSQLSEGAMELEIYPSQQLGTERESIELLQIGSLDMTKVSVGVMENFSPRMKVFGLPYLFRDRAHSFSVVDGPIGQELLDGGMKYWIKGMCYYDAGSRSFYTKEKPVNKPEDLKGLKIRVMESVTAMDMMESMGGSATPISWGELYTSLQQGVVDGAENNPPSFYLSRHYEVCKYYSLNEHTVLPDVLIMGTHLWKKLSDQEKEWLQEAVDRSVTYQRKLWAEAEQTALAEVEKAGVTIIRPDKKAFSDEVASVYKQYENDEDIMDLINRIKKTK